MHSTYSCDCDNLSCRRQFALSPDSPTPIYTQNYLEEENSVSFRDCQAVSEVANHTIVCEGEEKEEESVKLDVGSKTAGSKEADTNEGLTGSKEADTNEGSKTAESKEVDTNEGSKTAESTEVDTKDPEHSGVKMWVRASVMDDKNEEVLLSDSNIRPKKLRVVEKREASGESESGDERMDESEDKDMDEAERYLEVRARYENSRKKLLQIILRKGVTTQERQKLMMIVATSFDQLFLDIEKDAYQVYM